MGKDQACKFIKDIVISKYPRKQVNIVGFADKLKETTHLLYQWAGVKSGQYYEDNPSERNKIIPELGINVVDLWIKFGNHNRLFRDSIWIDPLFRNVRCDVLLIKDLRFPNECEAVDQYGGTKIKIHNPRIPLRDGPADQALEGYMRWHEDFLNDGDLHKLYGFCKEVVDKYLGDL